MLTNQQFHLTDEQLRKLSEWIEERSTNWAKDDDQFSLELSVSFSFSVFGRRVVASISENESFIVEDCLD